jgi:hypothetical protein
MNVTTKEAGKDVTAKVMYTPSAIYFSSPDMAAMMGGKEWFKLSYSDLRTMGGSAYGKVLEQQLGQSQDPRQYLKLMVASQDLRVVGTESVNGAQATHYAGTIDTVKSLSSTGRLTGLTESERKQLNDQMTSLGMKTMKADVWIDGDGWPRRIVQSGSSSKVGAFNLKIDFTDFGTPVNVTVPSASQVEDFGQIMQRLGDLTKQS